MNVGLLYFFAIAGTGIVGAALAGWASDNKYSLLGGVRAASQMVSYEVTLGLTLVGVMMVYGTLRIDEMVRWQAANTWGVFVQPLAFILFFTASVAEAKRIPFDLPEGESELVAGYFTEYSGMKFAMFYFSEYVAVVASSVLLTVLFLGGWHLPFIDRSGIHIQIGDTVVLHQTLAHVAVIVARGARLHRKGRRALLAAAHDPLDPAALPLRPAHAAELAQAPAGFAPEHPGDRAPDPAHRGRQHQRAGRPEDRGRRHPVGDPGRGALAGGLVRVAS